jgi:hypothetical protein
MAGIDWCQISTKIYRNVLDLPAGSFNKINEKYSVSGT